MVGDGGARVVKVGVGGKWRSSSWKIGRELFRKSEALARDAPSPARQITVNNDEAG